ncbi:MAG: ATP-grasp domain-containing protein [Thermodesulfobacteriota bacterium]
MTKNSHSSAKDKFSILIPDGESPFALSVIICLSQLPGLRIYILASDRWALARFSIHSTVFLYSKKPGSNEQWIDAIQDMVHEHGIDIVLPVDEPAIRALTIYGEALLSSTAIVPLPKQESFDIAADKWLTAKFLDVNNLPGPPTVLYDTANQLEQSLSGLSFPVLTKPRQGRGGNGIEFWEDISTLRNYLQKYSSSKKIIIQSFIKGFSIDCSVLSQDGKILAHTIQKELVPPQHRFEPARDIVFLENGEIFKSVEHLISFLKWSGVVHIDLLYDEQDNSFKILELNPRYWGSLLGSLCAEVNFPYLACLAGFNREFPRPEFRLQPFFRGRGAIEAFVQHILQKAALKGCFANTNIQYGLRDPLLVLVKIINLIQKRLFKHNRLAACSRTYFGRE